MPHKREKRSSREEKRKQQGSNHVPGKQSISNEAVPKSASRILNAFKIREDYKKRKRQLEDQGNDDKNMQKRRKTDGFQHKIKPGESIQHFYRRVEDDMRPVVRSATRMSRAAERKVRKTELESRKNEPHRRTSRTSKLGAHQVPREKSPPLSAEPKRGDPNLDKNIARPKEFEKLSTSMPRRLNDIAQAPPEIKKTPRGAKHLGGGASREGVLSMAQKSMMEQEREKAIARYRMLKASRSAPVGN